MGLMQARASEKNQRGPRRARRTMEKKAKAAIWLRATSPAVTDVKEGNGDE